MFPRLLLLISLLMPSGSLAQESCPGGTCVQQEDLELFLRLARDHKCRDETPPKIESEPVNIIVDREGRVFGSGSNPVPHELTIDWCNYHIKVQSDTQLQVAQRVEPTWGFRFRAKATFGVLVADLFNPDLDHEFHEALDGGILLEPFFIQWINLNGYVGVRSLGAGIGYDLTSNFGLYTGYALTWSSWRSNPYVSVYFAF